MDFFTPAIEMIKLLLWCPLRQINYLWMFRKNLTKLKERRRTLICHEEDVLVEINRAKMDGKYPKKVVQDWLKRVESVKKKISDIESEENKMCFKNCMPDYCSRRKVSKRSSELIGELQGLINECPSKDDVARLPLRAAKHTFCRTHLFGEEVIETYKKRIWECLENENIRKIGVYGMGGVGKTAIMGHINNRLANDNCFDFVLWVTLPKEELNLKRFQSVVAEAIQLKFSNENDEWIRSGELLKKLSGMKKFVLILDDVWKTFPLEGIGIPQPSKENGAKIVLTTRSLDVCNQMETEENIKVDVLPEKYAWDLFSSKVEKDVLTKPGIEDVAKLVAEKCMGLPLALITVGLALRNAKEISLWRNAEMELKRSTHKIRGMANEVINRLKFSYNHLGDERLRKCFLYCSLYPYNYRIDKKELINLWMWEGLIDEDEDKERILDKGSSILNDLIDASMLEKVPDVDDNVKYVKMHGLIRDLAIDITRDSPRFMVKTGFGLEEQPNEEEFREDIERISLSRNKIASLIGQPNCPKLRTLFLNENSELNYISPSFFLYMHGLRVLDLSRTKVEAWPESLSDMVNLHALLLNGCERLVVLPSLAKLKELRILNLSRTCIEELPPGMEGLIKLRYLDLSYTDHLKTIRVGIVLQLSGLEELSLIGSSWKFDSTNREAETIINEISGLKRLAILSINFEDMQSFLIYRESHLWRSLHKIVSFIEPTKERESDAFCNNGTVLMWIDDTNCCSVLDFDDHHLKIKQCWCNLVIPHVLIDSRAFKTCEISFCNCTDYIFKGGEDSSLSTIETLRVKYMENLKAISKGEHHGILQSLRILHICYCDTIKTLFSSDLLQSLQNIEEIVIRRCKSMEQMVLEEVDGEDIYEVEEVDSEDVLEVENIPENAISLPKLRVLRLEGLDNLKCICKRTLICHSLKEMTLLDCPQLSSLPLSLKKPTYIQLQSRRAPIIEIPTTLDGCIEGTSDWWNALHWEDANTKRVLQPLFEPPFGEKPFRRPYVVEYHPFRGAEPVYEPEPSDCSIM